MDEEINFIGISRSVSFFASSFFVMYFFAAPLLLIGTLFKRKLKSESCNLLFVFNTLVAWFSFLIFLLFVYDLFKVWFGQNPYGWHAFRGYANSSTWFLFYTAILLSFLPGMLFFIRKLRTLGWFILIFWLLKAGSLWEKIIIYITNQYRDYLPSNWHAQEEGLFWGFRYLAIIFLLIVFYIWAKKKGTLPFPSVFLK